VPNQTTERKIPPRRWLVAAGTGIVFLAQCLIFGKLDIPGFAAEIVLDARVYQVNFSVIAWIGLSLSGLAIIARAFKHDPAGLDANTPHLQGIAARQHGVARTGCPSGA
nr:hypothetical protein [Candidatus Sigynarchaeota archaeon]